CIYLPPFKCSALPSPHCAGEEREKLRASRAEIELSHTDDDPTEFLESSLALDVGAPLFAVSAMAVALVLDSDPQLRIREIDGGDRAIHLVDRVLDLGLRHPRREDHHSGQRFLGGID